MEFRKSNWIYEFLNNNKLMWKCEYLLWILFLIFQNFCFVAWHVELWCPFTTNNRQTFLRCTLESAIIDLSILILSFHIQNIFHIQLKQISATRTDHTRAFINFKTTYFLKRKIKLNHQCVWRDEKKNDLIDLYDLHLYWKSNIISFTII